MVRGGSANPEGMGRYSWSRGVVAVHGQNVIAAGIPETDEQWSKRSRGTP
jgi:hypothetical protein